MLLDLYGHMCIYIYMCKYVSLILIVNVGKFTIHGCYGIGKVVVFLVQDIFR